MDERLKIYHKLLQINTNPKCKTEGGGGEGDGLKIKIAPKIMETHEEVVLIRGGNGVFYKYTNRDDAPENNNV